jgi:hypothetical protein
MLKTYVVGMGYTHIPAPIAHALRKTSLSYYWGPHIRTRRKAASYVCFFQLIFRCTLDFY